MFRLTVFAFMSALLCLSVATSADAQPQRNNRAEAHAPLRSLPPSNRRIVHKGNTYFYSSGRFYRQNNGVYVNIGAPIGAVVPGLPRGYVTIGIGAGRVFYNAGVYYRKSTAGYVVIDEPLEAQEVVSNGTERLIIYPAAGQSEEQKSQDKFECYEWASAETGFDPTDPNSDSVLGGDYQRAMSACLEAREYVVK